MLVGLGFICGIFTVLNGEGLFLETFLSENFKKLLADKEGDFLDW
jgi:hypothetical protein